MTLTIKAVFNEECPHLVFDSKLIKKISDYRVGFEMKNQDHITFFGGNLTGVQVVRFLPADRDKWFEEILEVNEIILEDKVHSLPTVDADRHVSSDIMNISCVWLIHRIYTSKQLTDKQKKEAMVDVAMVMQFKFLTSRLYRLFRYPADPTTAAAAYAQLSYKFSIKAYGSWRALLTARAEEITSLTGIHANTIKTMESDKDVAYVLSDSQGRIKDILKNIYDVFMKTHESGTRFATTSSVAEFDGEQILKDRSKNTLAYSRYIHSIITDKNSFIKPELVNVIQDLMHTMPPKLFNSALVWMSLNYGQGGAGVISDVLSETLVHAFDYLSQNRQVIKSHGDLPAILVKLKGVYMSSRSTDPALIQLRQKTEDIAKNATGNRHPSILASIRSGILLYIVARSFTMKHYTTGALT